MSFKEDLRGELLGLSIGELCCARAALSTAILASGGVRFRGFSKATLSVGTEHEDAALYFDVIAKRFFGVTGGITASHTNQRGGRTTYRLSFVEDDTARLLDSLRMRDENGLFGIRETPFCENECCVRAALRSAFLICGYVESPERAYHLELPFGGSGMAEFTKDAFSRFSLPAKISGRKTQYVVYLKDGEAVGDALLVMGAQKAMLALSDTAVLKDVRNRVNRQNNCDSRNIDRSVEAGVKQIAAIDKIIRTVGLGSLTEPLREMAQLRLDNPNASFLELGELANPPIGKSGVNKRLRTIIQISEQLSE